MAPARIHVVHSSLLLLISAPFMMVSALHFPENSLPTALLDVSRTGASHFYTAAIPTPYDPDHVELRDIPTSSPTPTPASIVGYKYLGCYENGGSFILSKTTYFDNAMTPEMCRNMCVLASASVFGVDDGASLLQDCYCDNSLAQFAVSAPNSECSVSCRGNPTELCGAANRLNVYSATAPLSVYTGGGAGQTTPPTVTTTGLDTTAASSSGSASQPVSSMSTTTSSPSSSPGSVTLNIGVIVGIAVGSAVFAAAVCLLGFFCLRRRPQVKRQDSHQSSTHAEDAGHSGQWHSWNDQGMQSSRATNPTDMSSISTHPIWEGMGQSPPPQAAWASGSVANGTRHPGQSGGGVHEIGTGLNHEFPASS